MPSPILNLKFKGNKSFVAFSNLADSDSLTKTWKVCSKVASYLEQGQRLENLSWRLWHLQNLIVESDNARSKREFKKLSKYMGDKLDREKGRCIEELEAPGFKRNMSTDKIRLRAEEKERNREASLNSLPGTIKRMQFTFSVDKPAAVSTAVPVKKPDLKPSQQFKDSQLRRGRPATRSSPQDGSDSSASVMDANDKDPPSLTQIGRRPSPPAEEPNDMYSNDNFNDSDSEMHMHGQLPSVPSHSWNDSSLSLRFPSIFTNDFGPSALLFPQPSLATGLSYGEGMSTQGATRDGFSVSRPTIELPLDELLNDVNMTDSPGAWSSAAASTDYNTAGYGGVQDDVEMKPPTDSSASADQDSHSHSNNNFNVNANANINVNAHAHAAGSVISSVPSYPPMSQAAKEILPATIHPSQVAPPPRHESSSASSTPKPTLSVRTNSSAPTTRSGGPSATATSSMNPAALHANNSAPGGVKAECSNCGATHTPLWRRGLNDELNCNACGLYCKLHKRPRPKSMRNSHGEGRSQAVPRQDSVDMMGEPAQCYNCHTMATPLWRKDDEGKTVCNACGLYFKLHGSARPISMKSDVIRKRSRHDARRATGEPPSASPGASRRPSPVPQSLPSPTLAPDSSTTYNYDEYDFSQTSPQSELMGALGPEGSHGSVYNSQGVYDNSLSYSSYPGPYHPDYLQNLYAASDLFPFSSVDHSSDRCRNGEDMGNRSNKRRRMSQDSMSEPPSSTTSYSSYTEPSSATTHSHSQRSSLDFPYSNYGTYGGGNMRGASQNTFWHPPMLPQDKSPQTFIHPPMLPSEESPMDFLHPPMLPQEEADQLFASYLHPPMVPTDDSSMVSINAQHSHQHPHPPMFPGDRSYGGQGQNQRSQNGYYESSMVSYECNFGSGN